MKISARVTIDLKRHQKVRRAIQTGTGPVVEVLDAWGDSYRAFLLRRFDKFSLGGGNWKRLAPSTLRSKKKNRDKILVRSRFMRMKLERGVKMVRRIGSRAVFGFDMPMLHPGDSDTGGSASAKLTVEEIATIHDQGLGSAPRRRILVTPDDAAQREMRAAATKILAAAMRGE